VIEMTAKSVNELLKELEQPKSGIAPAIIFEDLSQKGLSGAWKELEAMDIALLKQFVALKELEAKANKVEYAYYFWKRIRNRLLADMSPIGEEQDG
jgi:hypothetical protein